MTSVTPTSSASAHFSTSYGTSGRVTRRQPTSITASGWKTTYKQWSNKSEHSNLVKLKQSGEPKQTNSYIPGTHPYQWVAPCRQTWPLLGLASQQEVALSSSSSKKFKREIKTNKKHTETHCSKEHSEQWVMSANKCKASYLGSGPTMHLGWDSPPNSAGGFL